MTAYWKDTFREITRSFGRYISLIIITALGAASVVGILATSIDMRAIADKTYKQRNLYDIQIKSTTGFSDEDISALRDIPGVGIVMPTSIYDTYIFFENETRTIRTFALPDELNAIELSEGRLPESTDECAIEQEALQQWDLQLGDRISLGLYDMGDYYDVFSGNTFTIVGVVVSPLFVIPYDRGNTSLGEGRLDYYMYLHPDAYELDVFTDVYILMEGSREMNNLSDAYYDAADEWSRIIERTGDVRVQVKVDEFIDAQREIDDGWWEYLDGVAELDNKVFDGRKELEDARVELDDAKIELDDAQAELDDAQIELEDAKLELEDAKLKSEDAKTELADAQKKLEDAQTTLDNKISDARAEIGQKADELENGMSELDKNRAALNSGQNELDQSRSMLLGNLHNLESTAPYGVSPELDAQYDMINSALSQLEEKQAELDAGRAELEAAELVIRDGLEQIRGARAVLERERVDAQREIDDAWTELDNGRAELKDAQAKINNARTELDDGWIEYDDGRAELEDGWAEYYDGLDEWRDGVETLEREEADALVELEDARRELMDAQETLDDAPTPEWFYFTRKDSLSFDSYYNDTLRLESIGYVFPLVFFIVAVLVSLTTMSRMVDEQRTQIGIYKALGYRTLRVIMKLIIYAFSAGVTGGVLGVVVGSNVFPRVIFGAYLHMYDMPPIETPIPLAISMVAIATSVGLVIIVTFVTSLRSMHNSPAEMMRPKAPPSGKRVFIEKIPFIWRRLKFTNKVTARNIFRYKKRFIMTLVGVAGCSALLLTSFGLRDSLSAIEELQYGRLMTYTSRAFLKEVTTQRQRTQLDSLMSGDWLYIREESLTADGSAFSVTMIVPESAERISSFINLYSRTSGETVPLTSGGILITEKLAREVNVSKGDNFNFTSSDGGSYTVRVNGVVENYIRHHIYMPPEVYADLFGAEPLYNSILTVADKASVGALLENSDVRAIVFTSDLRESISDSTDALEIVAIVLIILACLLAFIVLFNLTNINITERIRELATIKVLGFYDEELSMYIYRENTIVTLMGVALGLVAGIFLHGYVLMAAEIDLLMFPQIILPWSYMYSAALSVVFAVFVNWVMNFKLSGIDMVESLKNVE